MKQNAPFLIVGMDQKCERFQVQWNVARETKKPSFLEGRCFGRSLVVICEFELKTLYLEKFGRRSGSVGTLFE